jgi:V8-like Glu-specific endopeptidase
MARIGVLVLAHATSVLAAIGLSACGGDSDDRSGAGSKAVQPLEAPLSYVDTFGRTWLRADKPVVYAEGSKDDHIERGPEPAAVVDIAQVSLDEATAALRPKALRGDWEYTLCDEDAREFAREIQESARNDVPITNGIPGSTAVGETSANDSGDPSAPTRIVNGDDRFSIEGIKDVYPYNNVAVLDSAGTCTAFKLINHHTAITAAHCVHTGSAWKPRKRITFRPRSTVGTTCYGMTVPGCWDGDNRQCDYATIKFREGSGYCNFDTYNVGYLGWVPTYWWEGSMYHSLWGYPSEQMKQEWNYPEMVWDYNTMYGLYLGNNISHSTDATGGQSGSPLYRGGAYATGIYWGFYDGGSDNRAVGITQAIHDWMVANGGY